jgi:hypothetical protein
MHPAAAGKHALRADATTQSQPHPAHQLRLPALKALAVPTPSDVSPDTDTALIVQLSGVFPVAAGGDCLLKLLLPPTFPKQPPLFKLLPLKCAARKTMNPF